MKIVAIVLGVLALLVGVISYNVWRANHEPITSTPGAVVVGRQKLHAQLEQTKQTETQLEKENWNSIPQLRVLIKDHQDRITKLSGNKEAAEIVAYDHDSIARLEKRVTELEAQPPAEPPSETDSEAPQKAVPPSAEHQPAATAPAPAQKQDH